jgi:hypothetical protein
MLYQDARNKFSTLFRWHLLNGTRPTEFGKAAWGDKEFARALRATVSPKAVQHWRTGRHVPRVLDHIERALFGEEPAMDGYIRWRDDLRVAYRASSNKADRTRTTQPLNEEPACQEGEHNAGPKSQDDSHALNHRLAEIQAKQKEQLAELNATTSDLITMIETMKVPSWISRLAFQEGLRTPISSLPPVFFDNERSDSRTIVGVCGRDRPNFLQDVTRALLESGLHVKSVELETFDDRVVGHFFLTDGFGHKVTHRTRLASIEKRLSNVLNEVW